MLDVRVFLVCVSSLESELLSYYVAVLYRVFLYAGVGVIGLCLCVSYISYWIIGFLDFLLLVFVINVT